jgi:hypothetical protein
MKRVYFLVVSFTLASVIVGCNEQTVQRTDEPQPEMPDSSKANIINVSGKLFSIPSPLQTAVLIRNSNDVYRKEILADPKNHSNLATRTEQALNLGVFGTDMAYSSLFDDGQAALRYFKAIENVANELGVTAAIDAKLIGRLGANVGNADSLLYLTGRFYESADAYLKQNERYDIATLVLLGGWVESNYLTSLAALERKEVAMERLAEQKGAIRTLKEVIDSSVEDPFKETRIYALVDSIRMVYDYVDHEYEFQEPITMENEKRTVIRSKSAHHMETRHMSDLHRLLTSARKEIIAQ